MPEILVQTPDHMVVYHPAPGPADTLVVSFNHMRAGLAAEGFGTAFATGLGYAHVLVSEAGDSFYQALAPEDLAACLAPLTARHPRVFLYGASLGGHAALHFSSALGGTAVALAPRLPLHPYMTPFLGAARAQFPTDRLRHPDLPEIARRDLSPVVLFDPGDRADATYVARFVVPAFPLARLHPLPGAGHRVARLLAYQGRLRPVMTTLFATGEMPDIGFDPGLRPRRDLARALRALDRGQTARAARFLARVAREPTTPGLDAAIARLCEMTGTDPERLGEAD